MKPRPVLATICVGTLLGSVWLASGTAAASKEPRKTAVASPGAGSCAGLANLRLPSVEIITAASVAAGAPVPNVGFKTLFGTPATAPVASGLPAFCRVAGIIRPEAGSEIRFETWLPDSWDGRLHGVGIGGFAGTLDYHTLGMAVKGGQAGVATDTGHQAMGHESGWAKGQPQKVRDYGWRAIHLSTVTAKQLIRSYYGRAQDKSYFVGCSGGGRQGLMEAARFPEDYDGVVSGAPAASFTDLMMTMTHALQTQAPAGAAIRSSQIKLLQEEVLRQCDGVDGLQDGLVDDPLQCRFDTSRLACGTSSSDQCFSPAQVTALDRIYAGPRNSAGRQVAPTYLPAGSESGTPNPYLGWEGFLVGGPAGAPGARFLAQGTLQDLTRKPFATIDTFNWDRDPAKLRAAMKTDIDAPLNLSRFFARGGKLILWHGWADAAIPPENTLRYREGMLKRSGRAAASSTRLFMVPGVQHCMGGLGADSFGQLNAPQPGDRPERSMVSALQDWVEGRRPAPETMVARRGHGGLMAFPAGKGPERQKLLCAWPKKAVLKAGGDPDQASSYTCG